MKFRHLAYLLNTIGSSQNGYHPTTLRAGPLNLPLPNFSGRIVGPLLAWYHPTKLRHLAYLLITNGSSQNSYHPITLQAGPLDLPLPTYFSGRIFGPLLAWYHSIILEVTMVVTIKSLVLSKELFTRTKNKMYDDELKLLKD